MRVTGLIILFTIWNIIGVIVLAFSARIGYDLELDRLNPIYIYKDRKVNWFGCFCFTLLFNLLCPVATFCYWFVKLCTVGRKH